MLGLEKVGKTGSDRGCQQFSVLRWGFFLQELRLGTKVIANLVAKPRANIYKGRKGFCRHLL